MSLELRPQLWLLLSPYQEQDVLNSESLLLALSVTDSQTSISLSVKWDEPCSPSTATNNGRRQKDLESLGVAPWGLGTDFKPADFSSTDYKHLYIRHNCVLVSGGPVGFSGTPSTFLRRRRGGSLGSVINNS